MTQHDDNCHVSEHHRRQVNEGIVTPVLNPRPGGGPRTYLLTASMGIITGLAPAEQDFIDKQPPGTKVGLVREMFAFSTEHIDPGPEPKPTGVSDTLVGFVDFLATEAPVQYARATEHSALWWENPELVILFQSFMDRWTSGQTPDHVALMTELEEALEARFGSGPEPDARTTTDPSTND